MVHTVRNTSMEFHRFQWKYFHGIPWRIRTSISMEFNGKVPQNLVETTAFNSIDLHLVLWNSQELDHGIRISHWVTDVNGIYVFTIFHRFRCHCKLLDKFPLLNRKPLNLFWKVINTNYLSSMKSKLTQNNKLLKRTSINF